MHKESFWSLCWNRKLCHSQGPHPNSGSPTHTRQPRKLCLLFSFTLQLRGASADQSCNAISFPFMINIIKSCLSTPEQQQLQVFLLGIHHRHHYTHSTIFTVLAQDSKADGGYLFYTELTIYGTKELATVSSVDDKTSNRLT